MPLTIAHVCRVARPHVGGMETAVSGLSEALAARGHAVRVISLADGGWTAEDAGAVRLPRVGPRRYPFARGLLDAVRGADVVHVHGIDGLADQVCLGRARPPVGVSTHGGYLHTGRHAALKALWMRAVTRWTLSRADAVWFTSESDRDGLAAAGLRGTVLPNGVDVARFQKIERRPEPGRWVVIGRVDVHKGLDDLVDVLSLVRRPVRVEVLGPARDPALVDRLARRARRRGVADKLVLRGEVVDAEVDEALAGAELALFPSRHEGFGLALVEALAAGVPCVAADIPAFREIVSQDPAAAVLTSFRRPRLAAELLEKPLPIDVSRARALAATYAWEHRVLDYENAYETLLQADG